MTSRVEVQTALSRVLLAKVREDSYPSSTYMDMLEQMLPPELLREYLNVLLEKLVTDKRPSIDMLRRVQRIGAAL
jgi:hypothetical protein